MNLKKTIYTLLIATVVSGCSPDNAGVPDSAPVTKRASFSLTTRTSMGDNEGTPEDASSNELINSFKVIIVSRSDREVAAVITKSVGDGGDLASPVEEYFFNLPGTFSGSYDVYAVANISDYSSVGESDSESVREFFADAVEGDIAPADAVIKAALWNFSELMGTSDSTGSSDSPDSAESKDSSEIQAPGVKGLVPMAGFLNDVTITGVNDSFEIEVVRLYAKLEIKMGLAPGTTRSATVKKIELLEAQSGSVRFMPDYSNLGYSPENHLQGLSAPRKTLVFTPGKELPIPVADATQTEHTTVALSYLREMTAPANAANAFQLRVTLQRGTNSSAGTGSSESETDETGSPGTSGETGSSVATQSENSVETVQIALADHLQWINRNDHVIIPITLTDWTFDVSVLFYPPIGGYPSVITEKYENGSVSASFGTQGYFVITPILKEVGSDRPITMEEGVYSIESVETDNPALFVKEPTVDPETYEIVGELSSSTGTAKVTLRVNVRNSKGEPAVTYTKIIYIIRENPAK